MAQTDATPPAAALAPPLRLVRRLLPMAMLVVLILGLGGAGRYALSLGEPFAGVALVPKKEIKVWAVLWSTPPHWPGKAAGLQTSDRILCIGGYHPTRSVAGYERDSRYHGIECPNGDQPFADLFRLLYAGPEPTAELLVDRGGTLITVDDVPIVPFTSSMLLDLFLPLFLLGLGVLTVGAVVYWADSSREINLIFALFATITAAFAIDWIWVPRITDRLADALAVTLILTVPWVPLLGAVLFHWISLLAGPGRLWSFARRARRPYYLVSIGFSILGVLVYLLDFQRLDYLLSPVFFLYIVASLGLSVCWSVLSMACAYRGATSRRTRRQSGLILLGFVVVLVVATPLVLVYFGAAGPRYLHTAPFFGLAAVAMFAYAILRYQLFASKARVLNALLVGIFCVLVANVVYLILGQLAGLMPVLAGAVLVGVGLTAHRGPTRFFTRLLRREALDYQTVARFGRSVGELQGTESLLQAAGQVLHDHLDVERVDVWLLDPDHETLRRYEAGQPAGSQPIPAGLLDRLLAHPEPAHGVDAAGYGDLVDPDPIAVAAWAPLVDRGQAIGLMGLGSRWTGETYDDRDLELVGILARQMALSILNVRQFQRLEGTARLIRQVQENERLKIARELHDTVLQFLLVLTYGLDGLKPPDGEAVAEIERWQDRISVESARLRGLLSYLRAPEMLVQQGLVSAVETWIDQVSLGTDVSIESSMEPQAESSLSVEAQVAIYRVFREAIHNALKHAGCRQIVVRLDLDGEQVRFSIEDDGRGFDVDRVMSGSGKGYSSLQDMRTYVENLGGGLAIHSTPDVGTVVSGQVPSRRRLGQGVDLGTGGRAPATRDEQHDRAGGLTGS